MKQKIMSSISQVIENRRSRFPDMYQDRKIDKETLLTILTAANYAPTHRKTEPWRFKVVQGTHKERLGQFLVDKYRQQEESPSDFKAKKILRKAEKSAAIILITMQRDPKESVPEWEEIAATAMAVQNMWLVCTELGIGSYWSTPRYISAMSEFVDLAEGERCLGLFYMGYSDVELPDYDRGPIADKVEWINS
jgi:nitroreductase